MIRAMHPNTARLQAQREERAAAIEHLIGLGVEAGALGWAADAQGSRRTAGGLRSLDQPSADALATLLGCATHQLLELRRAQPTSPWTELACDGVLGPTPLTSWEQARERRAMRIANITNFLKRTPR